MSTLLLDSSAGTANAMILRDREVLAVASATGSTLSLLHELARRVLDDVSAIRGPIDEIAVVSGPGSWTGLHVGLTAAKTIAQVWDVPLVVVSALEALAASLTAPGERPLLPVIDARRGAFYSALYRRRDDGLSSIAPGSRREPTEIAKLLAAENSSALLVGNGGRAAAAALAIELGTLPEVVDLVTPSPAAFAATVAANRPDARHGDDRFSLTPDYMGDDFTITPRRSSSS